MMNSAWRLNVRRQSGKLKMLPVIFLFIAAVLIGATYLASTVFSEQMKVKAALNNFFTAIDHKDSEKLAESIVIPETLDLAMRLAKLDASTAMQSLLDTIPKNTRIKRNVTGVDITGKTAKVRVKVEIEPTDVPWLSGDKIFEMKKDDEGVWRADISASILNIVLNRNK